jgi:hypothetical protein
MLWAVFRLRDHSECPSSLASETRFVQCASVGQGAVGPPARARHEIPEITASGSAPANGADPQTAAAISVLFPGHLIVSPIGRAISSALAL